MDVLFYFMNLFFLKDLPAWVYLADKNKLLYFGFMELIQFFHFFCPLGNMQSLHNLSIYFWLFYVELRSIYKLVLVSSID